MRRILVNVVLLALFGLLVEGNRAHGQERKLLPTKGWGSLSGKVTLTGKMPAVESLVKKMMEHRDKDCCLAKDAKPNEKVDLTWIVDPKTNAIANVVVWVESPKGTYLPTHQKYQKRDDETILDQPHCAYLPRVAVFTPIYIDEKGKKVPTGQALTIKNSATVAHNVRVVGGKYNEGFNVTVLAKTEIDATKKLVPQRLPLPVKCDFHTWMGAHLFVTDHPYYAITREDGTFEMPIVPAGAEVNIMAWHEGVGFALKTVEGEKVTFGKTMTLKDGKNVLNFEVENK